MVGFTRHQSWNEEVMCDECDKCDKCDTRNSDREPGDGGHCSP